MASLVYYNKYIYNFSILLSYGRHYSDRMKKINSLIPENSSVLDICCGPCNIYYALKNKNIRYFGLDYNQNFVNKARQEGIRAEVFDIYKDSFPNENFDCIIMQGSLYQFYENRFEIIEKMLEATSQFVIVSEPIKNLVDRIPAPLATVIKKLKDPGTGATPHSFTEKSFDETMNHFKKHVLATYDIGEGIEKLYLLKK